MKITLKTSHLWLGLVLVLVGAINVWLLFFVRNKIDFKKLLAHKPKINLVVIRETSCTDCFDLTQVKDVLEREGGRVTMKVLDKADAQSVDLIEQYNIKFLPSFVATGEINDPALKPLWDNFGEPKDKAIIFNKNVPKYYEIATGKTFGDFGVTLITDNSCASCYDVNTHKVALKNLGMITDNVTNLEASSVEAKALIKKYRITSLPTILLRGDLAQYQVFLKVWDSVGTKEKDGTYVFREPGQKQMGTYKDLKTGKVIPQEILNDTGAEPAPAP